MDRTASASGGSVIVSHHNETSSVPTPGPKIPPETGVGGSRFKREFGARPELVEPLFDLLLAFHVRAVRAAENTQELSQGARSAGLR